MTDSAGSIFLYSTASEMPSLLTSIKLGCTGSIRAFYFDKITNYIFMGSTDGVISVVDNSKRDLMREITAIPYSSNLRIVSFDYKKNQILVGDQNGRVTVLDMATGVAKCV